MLLLDDCRVLTMNDERPRTDCILIDGDIIIGTGAAEVAKVVGRARKRVERLSLGGRVVMPGFIESHVHPTFFGIADAQVNCRPPLVASIRDLVERLRERLITTAKTEWVIGTGYDDTLLEEDRHPDRSDLDSVSAVRPIVITHISGHFAVANSAALRIAKIDNSTKDPVDGRIMRDGAGAPTGLMWEIGAVRMINEVMPKITEDDLVRYTESALKSAASRGITTVHDMAVGLQGGSDAGDGVIRAYGALENGGRLPVRVRGFLRGDRDIMNRIPAMMTRTGDLTVDGDGLLKIVGIKYWADGSIQGLSAALSEPYVCCGDDMGELNYDQEILNQMVGKAIEAGYQVAVHANGDRAIDAALYSLELAMNAKGGKVKKQRHRLEHVQVVSKEQLARIAAAGINVSFFINHVFYWGDRHRDRFLGHKRAKDIDPLRTAQEAGVRFGIHSDCPVTMMDPLFSLWVAVNRITAGGEVLGGEQCVGVAEGLKALTTSSAWLTHDEGYLGMIRRGYKADVVVLDEDPLVVDRLAIKDIGIDRVMMNGNWTYRR